MPSPKAYYQLKVGTVYQVTSEPPMRPVGFPPVGSVGTCKWVSSQDGACLDINGKQFILPFACIEECSKNIEDGVLVSMIVENPKATLKILRGLWRMTKHKDIRDLMERGELPVVSVDADPKQSKTREDYDKDWEEYLATGAFAREIIS